MSLSLPEFVHLLDTAFDTPVQIFVAWPSAPEAERRGLRGHELWKEIVNSQIFELRKMQEVGTLSNPYRYYGVETPGGETWYNFDPLTYIECGAAGTFDDAFVSWFPDLFPMIRSVEGNKGYGEACDASEPRMAEQCLDSITWDLFARFLHQGRNYE